MLKQAFANFANRTNEQPENDAERDEPLDGNAFSGSSAKQSREGEILLQAGYMSGEGNSSLSFVNNRLRALFGSEASPENKQKAMDARLYAQIMMQQQMQRFRQALEEMDRALMWKIAELENQIYNLRQVRELVLNGEFDATNSDHRAMAEAARPITGKTADEIAVMSPTEIIEVFDAAEEAGLLRLEELHHERESIGAIITRIDSGLDTGEMDIFDSEEFARDGEGRFVSSVLQNAAEAAGVNPQDMTLEDWDLIAEELEKRQINVDTEIHQTPNYSPVN
ncbi:MAG: hypothetical protein ACK4VI_04335 [Alphaproteobacteria bacterium]